MRKFRFFALMIVAMMGVTSFAQSRAQIESERRNPNHPYDIGNMNPNSSRNKGNIRGFLNDFPYYSNPRSVDAPRIEFWRFVGSVGKYQVEMDLSVPYYYDNRGNQYGDNCQIGFYRYLTHPSGHFNLVLRSYDSRTGYIVMEEYDGPRRTGHIEGQITAFSNGGRFKGTYFNSIGQKQKVKLMCTGLVR